MQLKSKPNYDLSEQKQALQNLKEALHYVEPAQSKKHTRKRTAHKKIDEEKRGSDQGWSKN